MRILCIGDVVGQAGRQALFSHLRKLKRETRADFCIVNGENAADGNGIDRGSMEDIFAAGADVITGGNHSLQKKCAADALEEMAALLRPHNLGNTFGKGWYRAEGKRYDLLVINLQGMLGLPEIENPFTAAETLLKEIATPRDIIAVDFHAEATSEKQAMGYFLDGKVSLVFGTHTHIPTADEWILPGGTGYITDIGMTGVRYSVLGKDNDPCVHNFVTWGNAEARRPIRDAEGACFICGLLAEIEEETKRCIHIERIRIG
ncbi:MAG: YmdB family metallophosphoesterase [Clostridia bacterium]|nr:YmdB family metallophosphoesterase [Clostridia bacterium]